MEFGGVIDDLISADAVGGAGGAPISRSAGHPKLVDDEYVRKEK